MDDPGSMQDEMASYMTSWWKRQEGVEDLGLRVRECVVCNVTLLQFPFCLFVSNIIFDRHFAQGRNHHARLGYIFVLTVYDHVNVSPACLGPCNLPSQISMVNNGPALTNIESVCAQTALQIHPPYAS